MKNILFLVERRKSSLIQAAFSLFFVIHLIIIFRAKKLDKVRQKWGRHCEFYCKYYTKNILFTVTKLIEEKRF